MDYLNYGNRVKEQPQKPQPQKPQPQGFGQQKVQLTEHDFSFGDLSQQTTEYGFGNSHNLSEPIQPPLPDQQVDRKDEMMQLFPTPLLICPCPFEYGKELEWIKKQSLRKENKNTQTGETLNRQSEDTFILDKPEMSRVRQFIDSKIKLFAENILGSDSEVVMTQSWLNKNGKGESHHEHIHPNSMISGVWYPQIHEKLPPIQFRNPKQRDVTLGIKNYNHFNSATYMLPMRRGELILFPSSLSHSVPRNLSNEERISLSFNTWSKGSLGEIESLTYLPFDRLM